MIDLKGSNTAGFKILKVAQLVILLAVSSQTMALKLNSEELDYFKRFFNGIQPQSFANNREYCGYIGYNDEAQFIATPPKKASLTLVCLKSHR